MNPGSGMRTRLVKISLTQHILGNASAYAEGSIVPECEANTVMHELIARCAGKSPDIKIEVKLVGDIDNKYLAPEYRSNQ